PAESASFGDLDPLRRVVFGTCTSRDQAPVYAQLTRDEVWVTPTLSAAYEFAVLPERAVPLDSLSRFVSDSLRAYLVHIFEAPPTLPASASAVGRRLFAKRQQTVGAIYRAGVPLLAGTDAPMRNVPPGFGLHEELLNLVRSGLPPMAALRA